MIRTTVKVTFSPFTSSYQLLTRFCDHESSTDPVVAAVGTSSRWRKKLALLMSVITAATLSVCGLNAWAAPVSQILETDNDTLTTYQQTSKTSVQNIRALVDQRGVNLDGGGRAGSTFPMALSGNAIGDGGMSWDRNASLAGVRLFTGTYGITDVDLSFPAEGFSWAVGRSYNARQTDSGGNYFDSTGYQGANWFQMSQPEILLFQGATADKDVVYLIYGADRFIEFKRFDATSNDFKAKDGAAGQVVFAAGAANEPDTYTYTDQRGNEIVFFGFDVDASPCDGQFWKMTDPDGNTAYVGDATTGSTAISNGYNVSGQITTAYDPTGRKFTYTYTDGYLTQVKAEINDSGWVEVGRVDYLYYVNADDYGQDGDLKLVTITTPLSDSGTNLIKKKYYRYWEGAFNVTTNPGHEHLIKYIYDFEGTRNYDWDQDSLLDDDFLTASNASLQSYTAAYFEYDSDRRITEAYFNGACGCSGGNNGTHYFTYESNGSYTDGAGYDEDEWMTRTVVQRPDGSFITQYFDEVGQPLARVITDADPANTNPYPSKWVTDVDRNADGQVFQIFMPDSISGYTHSTASITQSTTTGLIRIFNRQSTGDMKGFLVNEQFKEAGTGGSAYYLRRVGYTSASVTTAVDVIVVRPVINSDKRYTVQSTLDTATANETTLTYSQYTGETVFKQTTVTNPVITTGQNGPGVATTQCRYMRKDGTTAFTLAADGIYNYSQYTDGRLVKRIVDAQMSNATDFATGDDPLNDFGVNPEPTAGERVITTYTYDKQGRIDTVTAPDGIVSKTYYSKLADGRMATLRYPKYVSGGTPTYYGPVSFTVRNLVGQTESSGIIALTGNSSTTALASHVDETKSDPLDAFDSLGTVARYSTSIFTDDGNKVTETRSYFDIPTSGAGTEGTNYDASFVDYDDMGHRWRSKDATGTIRRTAYDAISRPQYVYVGTNDSTFVGGEPSGTDNMVKISETVYDSGNDGGNNYVTKTIAFVQDSATDKRETTYTRDKRGRLVYATTPQGPFAVNKYDNLGRTIATGLYSSTTNLTSTTDPTTATTDRVGLSETKYDAMGRVYQSIRHKINASTGADDDSITSDTWYDDAGRTIKIVGGQISKTIYDRLGRATHSFTLAKTDDTAYTDADDVTGDIVLVENQTAYESSSSNDVLMSVSISRHHDDYDTGTGETTGALDTNADNDDLKITAANITGRVSITASWFDDFGRVTDTVSYGTNGITGDGAATTGTFNRNSLTIPARSDTALRTSYTYNDDGTLKETTDPKGIINRTEYDDLGRQTAVIRNYINGVPSGTTGDDDLYTRYVYTDGLQTKIWVDLDGDNVEDTDDQVTTYTYGVSKGTAAGDSKIAVGNLLQKVQYPDSSGGTDVVTYAYNAQQQQIWTKDQAGNVLETDFDTGGRETHRRATTTATGFDTAVLRISTTYDAQGRVDKVDQYDNAAVGSGSIVDEIQYSYDDWGNVIKFAMDRNSAITSGQLTGANGYYDFEQAYTKSTSTSGRKTVRLTSMTWPSGDTADYSYLSANGIHDDEVSRVTRIKVGAVTVVQYAYTGVGQVVKIEYPQPNVMWQMHGSTTGSYPDLDNFNRVTSSRWTKDLTPTDIDFYDVDLTYDRNSNITLAVDNVLTGFDVDYTNDSLNRLTDAEEGTWGGSSITTRSRQQIWTLDQVGNWNIGKLDLNGDGDFTDADEYDDHRTHDKANELTARDTDNNGTNNYTLTYDALGNLTDDGEYYEYVYDVFGRLRKVKNTTTQALVAEYKYNGLGFRISVHEDTDTDGDVDASDLWYHFVYDTRWRIVATFRADDNSPKEQFLYHQAGLDGRGGSSYIDAVVLRQKDDNSGWTSAADGVLEQRYYYCQNWRADVSAIVTSGGKMMEWVKYSSYGIPFGLPAGDTDSDGDCDQTDINNIDNWVSGYDVRYDLDLDGDIDATDSSRASTTFQGTTLGWGVLSSSSVANRKGYAGYEYDEAVSKYHVRNRILDPALGRWTRRDPLGYLDGMSLYEYVASRPIIATDQMGLARCAGCGDLGQGGDPIQERDCLLAKTRKECQKCAYDQYRDDISKCWLDHKAQSKTCIDNYNDNLASCNARWQKAIRAFNKCSRGNGNFPCGKANKLPACIACVRRCVQNRWKDCSVCKGKCCAWGKGTACYQRFLAAATAYNNCRNNADALFTDCKNQLSGKLDACREAALVKRDTTLQLCNLIPK